MTADNPPPLQMLIEGNAAQAAAEYRALMSAVEAQPPGLLIRVSLVLDIIDEVERDHDVDLHDIAARIRERIEEATR